MAEKAGYFALILMTGAFGIWAFAFSPLKPPAPPLPLFPSKRDNGAGSALLFSTLLAAELTVQAPYAAVLLFIVFGLALPVLVAGLEGRRPFLYGCGTAPAYSLWGTWLAYAHSGMKSSIYHLLAWLVLMIMAFLSSLLLHKIWTFSARC